MQSHSHKRTETQCALHFFAASINFVAALAILSVAAFADDEAAGNAGRISLGGRLYDNLWLETGTEPPSERNPAYPASVDIPSANTWRCVSCHGWDYRGRDGQLGQISSAKEFTSLRNAAGSPKSAILDKLTSGTHADLVRTLTSKQTEALALFVHAGQHDVNDLLADGRAIGDPKKGKDIFEGVCVSCHQADGKAFIEGEMGDKPALGWVALNKPEQALHKIRNGAPEADMVSMRFLELSQLADLLAYLQTLDPSPAQ